MNDIINTDIEKNATKTRIIELALFHQCGKSGPNNLNLMLSHQSTIRQKILVIMGFYNAKSINDNCLSIIYASIVFLLPSFIYFIN